MEKIKEEPAAQQSQHFNLFFVVELTISSVSLSFLSFYTPKHILSYLHCCARFFFPSIKETNKDHGDSSV